MKISFIYPIINDIQARERCFESFEIVCIRRKLNEVAHGIVKWGQAGFNLAWSFGQLILFLFFLCLKVVWVVVGLCAVVMWCVLSDVLPFFFL